MKQNYKLILLNDGRNILVSDELTNIEAQEIEHYQTYDRKFFKIIGGTERTPTLSYSDEVKQILRDKYGWVDVEEFVSNHFKNYWKKEDGTEMRGEEISAEMMAGMLCETSAYINGFKAHQSITNKMFSLEDLRLILSETVAKFSWGKINNPDDIEKIIQDNINSLQQPIELNVEVEMEAKFDKNPEMYGTGMFNKGSFQPKITNNSIHILKIINNV